MTETTQYYRVADLPFAIEARTEHFTLLPNYEPFIADADASPMFVLHVCEEVFPDMEGCQMQSSMGEHHKDGERLSGRKPWQFFNCFYSGMNQDQGKACLDRIKNVHKQTPSR